MLWLWLVIGSVIFITSCQSDEKEQLQYFEDTFAGTWTLESCQLPAWGLGIYHQGDTLFKDTVLTNIGQLLVPDFRADNLLLNNADYMPLELMYVVADTMIPIELNYIFPRENGAFVALRTKIDGTAMSDVERFLYSSRVLFRNAELRFTNFNEAVLFSTSENSRDTLKLRRD